MGFLLALLVGLVVVGAALALLWWIVQWVVILAVAALGVLLSVAAVVLGAVAVGCGLIYVTTWLGLSAWLGDAHPALVLMGTVIGGTLLCLLLVQLVRVIWIAWHDRSSGQRDKWRPGGRA